MEDFFFSSEPVHYWESLASLFSKRRGFFSSELHCSRKEETFFFFNPLWMLCLKKKILNFCLHGDFFFRVKPLVRKSCCSFFFCLFKKILENVLFFFLSVFFFLFFRKFWSNQKNFFPPSSRWKRVCPILFFFYMFSNFFLLQNRRIFLWLF